MTTPITFSADDPSARWRHHQAAVVTWLAANDLEASNTRSVTVHDDHIDLVEILRGEDGKPYAVDDELATAPRTVPLIEPLPAELVEALR